jgi:hypothetical protein
MVWLVLLGASLAILGHQCGWCPFHIYIFFFLKKNLSYEFFYNFIFLIIFLIRNDTCRVLIGLTDKLMVSVKIVEEKCL